MATDKTLEQVREYFEVSNKLKEPNLPDSERYDLLMRQVGLATIINGNQEIELEKQYKKDKEQANPYANLTIEEKLDMYLQGKGHLLPQDGLGKGTYGGRILPTEEEVKIGMYPDRSLFSFNKFTCGIYRFYATGLPFEWSYVGYSQYIEYALHAQFCRWRSEKKDPNKPRKRKAYIAKSLRYMLDTYPDNIKFEIIEEVPYSLLSAACYNQRMKHKAMWQYNLKNSKNDRFDPSKLIDGVYSH